MLVQGVYLCETPHCCTASTPSLSVRVPLRLPSPAYNWCEQNHSIDSSVLHTVYSSVPDVLQQVEECDSATVL